MLQTQAPRTRAVSRVCLVANAPLLAGSAIWASADSGGVLRMLGGALPGTVLWTTTMQMRTTSSATAVLVIRFAASGIGGKNTQKIVREWQGKNGLKADGVVGPMTWNMMGLHQPIELRLALHKKMYLHTKKDIFQKGNGLKDRPKKNGYSFTTQQGGKIHLIQ